MLHRFLKATLACLCLLGAGQASAQEFPTRPITILVPYGAGGLTDQLAREVGAQLQRTLKQTVIIDNRAGGGGQIAMAALKAAPADGHTLLVADFGPLAINTSLFRKLNYDVRRDLQPVTQLLSSPSLLVVAPDSPHKTVADLFAEARRRAPLTYASPAVGSGGHLFGTMLSKELGVPLTHVAYRGSGLGLTDVANGQVDFMFDTVPSSGQFAQSGRVRALAIGAERRSPQFPDVPTLKELGWGHVVSSPWFGMVARAGTPAPVLQRLHAAVVAAIREPAVAKKFTDQGVDIVTSTPQEFAAFIQAETDRWGKVIREAGMTVE
jgi:tripartite-type tricarboxylate transporter receptor subunit TctC